MELPFQPPNPRGSCVMESRGVKWYAGPDTSLRGRDKAEPKCGETVIWQFLFKTIPRVYESQFSLEVSVQRLKSVLRSRWSLSPGLYGKVSDDSLVLHRLRFNDNPFAPIFHGWFITRDDKLFLEGYYRIRDLAFLALGGWLIFLLALIVFIATSDHPSDYYIFLFFGSIVMPVMFAAEKWLSRNDVDDISRIIEEALGSRLPED